MKRRKQIQFREKRKIKLPEIKRLRKIIVILLFLMLLALPFFLIPRMIKINKIECESQYGPCSENLSQQISEVQGKNLIEANKFFSELFKEKVFVSEYSTKYKLPDKLKVYVKERKAYISLIREGVNDKFIAVDLEGHIISIQKNTQLPILIIRNDIWKEEWDNILQVGNTLPHDMIMGVELLEGCFKLFNSKLAFLGSNFIEVDHTSNLRILLPLDGNRDELFGSLTLVLSRLKGEKLDSKIESVKTIDMRYANPVLR